MNRAALLLACLGFLPQVAAVAQDDASSPTVATHYFYWYRYPDRHFPQPDARSGGEGHRHHFVEPEAVDFEDANWHRGEFAAMAQAGIGVALPVYWGCPDCGVRGGTEFSDLGLPAMVEALDALAGAGVAAPRLGLFYDTSTLAFGGRSDLTQPAGRQRFVGTVLQFFAQLPRRHWARHRERPLVVLYGAGFASRWDAGLGAALRVAFEARFDGERPFLVADASWGAIGQDATTSWGAALHGPKLHGGSGDSPRVAQIGPGYDDSPVPGRRTPIRPREGGAFYRHSWRAATQHRPEIVLIETWNELHEGTGICATREFGDQYLQITAEYVQSLRTGEPGAEVPLENSKPVPRPDRSWGGDAADREFVAWRAGEVQGMRPLPWADGPIEISGDSLAASCPSGRPGSYVYFQVSDFWRFAIAAGEAVPELELALEGEGLARVTLDYDSNDAGATLHGAYRRIPAKVADARGAVFQLPNPHFANRQNGGADLRLVLPAGARVVLRRVTLGPRSD